MRKHILPVTVALLTVAVGVKAFALGPSDYMGLTPQQMQSVIDSQRAYDEMNLRAVIELKRQEQEAISERNRQIEYQQRNPFANCTAMGEVRGKDFEEMKALGVKMGATNYQLIETTASYVRANIYSCPQQK
ncbi:hypothetical protein GEOBRER4_n1007 [Citrifermentans bremense]|uniref:Uncharacterized protein n=1 Tax=Citrifermentans bremense TaxID=60035 RepID=A0A6S6M3J1_9BACT|nr:hypothetical protein [Citrifermentans bremense]BCG46221.1 hypothetical protein GEOBRER4_n1007 [Citrifermentans bremense]